MNINSQETNYEYDAGVRQIYRSV